MASFAFEADHDVAKMMRATSRATQLHIKRAELARVHDLHDWTWGRGVDDAKPHRGARAAVRTCLAKGIVEAQEDMPSIVCISSKGKGARRKPAIAHVVNPTKACDDTSRMSDVETTTNEGHDDELQQASDLETPQDSPVFGLRDAPQDLAPGLAAWPALAAADDAAAIRCGASAGELKLSHRDVALRFADACVEEQVAAQRHRAKKEEAVRSSRAAQAWKVSYSKRRLRLQAARKVRQAKANARAERARPLQAESLPLSKASFETFEAGRDTLKMMRAATRATKLHIKRAELARVHDLHDWTWGRGVDDAKPHRGARAAVRTCLAKGIVEAQEDMPSIVCMSSMGKGARRKPAVAGMVPQAKTHYVCEEAASAVEDDEGGSDEGTAGKPSTQEAPVGGARETPKQPVPELDDGTWVALPRVADAEPAQPAGKRAGCVIC